MGLSGQRKHVLAGCLVAQKLRLSQASVFLDLSNFYDLVDHHLLVREAMTLGFPPLVLYLCLAVHKGPRVLQAGEVCSQPIVPQRGIIAGCPYGVVFAKLVLWTLMAQIQTVCKPQGITTGLMT